jgi:hypothetical protein
MWVATPLSYDSFIHYTSPVLTGAQGEQVIAQSPSFSNELQRQILPTKLGGSNLSGNRYGF